MLWAMKLAVAAIQSRTKNLHKMKKCAITMIVETESKSNNFITFNRSENRWLSSFIPVNDKSCPLLFLQICVLNFHGSTM